MALKTFFDVGEVDNMPALVEPLAFIDREYAIVMAVQPFAGPL